MEVPPAPCLGSWFALVFLISLFCFPIYRCVCGLSFVPVQELSWILRLRLPSSGKGFGDILGRETATREWLGAKALAAAARGGNERNEIQCGASPWVEVLLGPVAPQPCWAVGWRSFLQLEYY